MAEPTIKVEDIWKRYDDWVLKGATFSITPKNLTMLCGQNGSGKTTLLKILAGLTGPSRGRVVAFGKPVSGFSTDYKKVVGVLLHDSMLYDELTVDENLTYYARMYGLRSWRASPLAQKVVRLFGLEEFLNRRVAELSHGWRKRSDIVRAILHDPDVVLLDEPLSGLDARALDAMSNLLAELASNKTVLFTSLHAESRLESLLKFEVRMSVIELVNGEVKVG